MQNPWLLSQSITAEWGVQSDAPLVFTNPCGSDLLFVPSVPTIKTTEKETGRSAKSHPRFKKNSIPFSLTILLSNTHLVQRRHCSDSCLIWINSSNGTGDMNLVVLGWTAAESLTHWWNPTARWVRKAFMAWPAEKGCIKWGETCKSQNIPSIYLYRTREKLCCIWHVIYYSSFSFIKLDFDSPRKVSDSQLFPSSFPV